MHISINKTSMGDTMVFKNDDYTELTADLIHDIFYSNASSRNKMASIRQYTEILFRKILDLDKNQAVMLGDRILQGELKKKSNENSLIMNGIETIRLLGNKYTHTKYVGSVTFSDEEKAFDALLDVSAYLFVDYFSKYKFGDNNHIQSCFSILPPIIRYKVLNNLYYVDKTNVSIIDKLVLSILKAHGQEQAFEWIDIHCDELQSIVIESPFGNDTMYNVAFNKIRAVGEVISNNGSMYKTFEEAFSHFQQYGNVPGRTYEVKEFNDLMELLYMGRKSATIY